MIILDNRKSVQTTQPSQQPFRCHHRIFSLNLFIVFILHLVALDNPAMPWQAMPCYPIGGTPMSRYIFLPSFKFRSVPALGLFSQKLSTRTGTSSTTLGNMYIVPLKTNLAMLLLLTYSITSRKCPSHNERQQKISHLGFHSRSLKF